MWYHKKNDRGGKITNMTNSLFDFIKKCPDPYHASAVVTEILENAGYTRLDEYAEHPVSGRYYVTRGNAVAAFRIPENPAGFMITASHSDSPGFRLKMSGSKDSSEYTVLCTERYGGMINYSWFDRALELSGRAVISTEDGIRFRNFRTGAPVAVIPSVAPHLNRKVNTDFTPDVARDLVPLFGMKGESIKDFVAELCGISADDLVSFDGVLSCADDGFIFGKDGCFISAPRLDDLMCAYTMLEGFLAADDSASVPVYCLYDGEEIGSRLRDGADSDFLATVLRLIAGDEKTYRQMLENSILISSDNAHAVHPNHPELSDSADVKLNGGLVVKRSASRSYMTEGVTDGIVCGICRRAGVPVQHFSNRSDLPGGSTLGAIAVTGLPVLCADIGAPQLAMHSAVETAGAADVAHMTKFATGFYSSSIEIRGGEIKIIK